MFRRPGQVGFHPFGDGLRNLAFHRKNIGQFAIVGLGPQMRVGRGMDQLHIDAHLAAGFLHTTLQNICYAQLLRDLRQIIG